MNVVVTGASGFVGRELVALLSSRDDWHVVAAARRPDRSWPSRVRPAHLPDLADPAQQGHLEPLVAGADAVVHLAARTPGGDAGDEARVMAVNAHAVGRLAQTCVRGGVKRFVLVSSSRVCGAVTGARPIDEVSPPAPDDAYARSKLAAEQAVMASASARMSWSIVRPPLIYGPGMRGPLLQLARAIARGVPLPLGSIRTNRRDMVGVRNLCRFLELCLEHPKAANELFVVRDGEPTSTRGLIEAMAKALRRPARLVPVPAAALGLAARLAGRGAMMQRLLGDHRIEDAKARRQLGWRPEVGMQFDLERMAHALAS